MAGIVHQQAAQMPQAVQGFTNHDLRTRLQHTQHLASQQGVRKRGECQGLQDPSSIPQPWPHRQVPALAPLEPLTGPCLGSRNMGFHNSDT